MAKIKVIFNSKTGNTQTMALAVAKGAKRVGGIDVDVMGVQEAKKSICLMLMA